MLVDMINLNVNDFDPVKLNKSEFSNSEFNNNFESQIEKVKSINISQNDQNNQISEEECLVNAVEQDIQDNEEGLNNEQTVDEKLKKILQKIMKSLEKINNKDEKIELNDLESIMDQIKLLINQLQIKKSPLAKVFLDSYNRIKNEMLLNSQKNGKEELFLLKLLQLFQNMKEELKLNLRKDNTAQSKEQTFHKIINDEINSLKEILQANAGNESELDLELSDKDIKKLLTLRNNKKKVKSSERNTDSGKIELIEKQGKANKNVMSNFQIKDLMKNSIDQQLKNEPVLKKTDIQELVQKVTNKIKMTLAGNKNEIVINMKPEFLGKVRVKLQFEGKVLTGKFIVDNIYAEKVFKDSMAQLKVNFQNMGLEVQNFDVKLNEKRDFNFGNSFGHSNDSFNDFNNSMTEEEIISPQWASENYDNLIWLAQNINIVI